MERLEVDAFDFCRRRDARSGETAVASLPRLAAETIDSAGTLRWAVQGGVDMRGNPQMSVEVSGRVNLRCQRCLGSLPQDIVSQASVVVAADDASADLLDEQLADEPVEVVVGSSDMDLMVLVEDEALLALPQAPRHEDCEGGQAAKADAPAEKKESPFAVLGKLKR